MEECSLDLIFLLGTARPFVSLVGRGCFFPIDIVKAFIFVTIESVLFIIATSLTLVSTSKNISDQHISKF